MSDASVSREAKRLPIELRLEAFLTAWEKWLGYLSRQPGRKDFLTIDAHLGICRDITKRKGISAAIDAIEYAIASGMRRPCEDTRPASKVAAKPSVALNDAAARAAASTPGEIPDWAIHLPDEASLPLPDSAKPRRAPLTEADLDSPAA